jgi:hypothetical protein
MSCPWLSAPPATISVSRSASGLLRARPASPSRLAGGIGASGLGDMAEPAEAGHQWRDWPRGRVNGAG